MEIFPAKKKRRLNEEKHPYPVIPPNAEDEISVSRNERSLQEETEKAKPNPQKLKELMARTLPNRVEWIRSECPPLSAILEKYPLLKKASYVSFP